PVLALGVAAILRVILANETLAVAPDRLHDPRPGIPDADVAGLAGALRHFLVLLVVDDRVDAGDAGPGAAGLHRVEPRFRAAEEPPGLRLPPGVHDHSLAFPHHIVIPLPDLRLDRLTHGGHVLEVVPILGRLIGARLPEHADRRWRGVEYVDV